MIIIIILDFDSLALKCSDNIVSRPCTFYPKCVVKERLWTTNENNGHIRLASVEDAEWLEYGLDMEYRVMFPWPSVSVQLDIIFYSLANNGTNLSLFRDLHNAFYSKHL